MRRRQRTMLSGFGEAEEAVEATIQQPRHQGLKMAIAVGSVGFIGLGLLWGMSRASGKTAQQYRWGGV